MDQKCWYEVSSSHMILSGWAVWTGSPYLAANKGLKMLFSGDVQMFFLALMNHLSPRRKIELWYATSYGAFKDTGNGAEAANQTLTWFIDYGRFSAPLAQRDWKRGDLCNGSEVGAEPGCWPLTLQSPRGVFGTKAVFTPEHVGINRAAQRLSSFISSSICSIVPLPLPLEVFSDSDHFLAPVWG